MELIIISGNLTANPQSRIIDGKEKSFSVCNFNVAVNRVAKGNKLTSYYRVSCFGKQAENAMKYLFRGSKVLVTGRPYTSAYTDRNGKAQASLEVEAERIKYLSSKKEDTQQTQEPSQQPSPDEFMSVPEGFEEELPFN